MKFGYPAFLFAAPFAAGLVWLLLHLARTRRDRLAREFAGGAGRAWADPGYHRNRLRLDLALLVLTVGFLCVALARPMVYRNSEQSELQGLPYIIAVDASRSMLAADVRPNRWIVTTMRSTDFWRPPGTIGSD